MGLLEGLCLLVALHLAEGKECLIVGDLQTGYIIVPPDAGLCGELDVCCNKTCRTPSKWVQVFRLTSALGVHHCRDARPPLIEDHLQMRRVENAR